VLAFLHGVFTFKVIFGNFTGVNFISIAIDDVSYSELYAWFVKMFFKEEGIFATGKRLISCCCCSHFIEATVIFVIFILNQNCSNKIFSYKWRLLSSHKFMKIRYISM